MAAMEKTSVRWDPAQYGRFASERARPMHDLLARVPAGDPAYVVDLGCGPGELTRELLDRWPAARVVGVDNSPEMHERAARLAVPDRLDFVLRDVRDWTPERPVDVLLSNATLQWVPGHEQLLGRFVDALARPARGRSGGTFAFQVPGNFDAPSHRLLAELRDSPRWAPTLGRLAAEAPSVLQPTDYLDALARLGCTVDAWETTYLHVLPGEDAVLEWIKGTGLRPVLGALEGSADDRAEFLADYGARLRAAYPRQAYGTVLPFRRIFVVARRAR
jgi:trans-aconitate 2-methyltransferase